MREMCTVVSPTMKIFENVFETKKGYKWYVLLKMHLLIASLVSTPTKWPSMLVHELPGVSWYATYKVTVVDNTRLMCIYETNLN